MAQGRGAWPGDGEGGTRNAKNTGPGPYYTTGVGYQRRDASGDVIVRTPAERVVHLAVKAYQERLAVHGYDVGPRDGLFGSRTTAALKEYQAAHRLVSDGLLGPSTSKVLLSPLVSNVVVNHPERHRGVTLTIVRGLIGHESGWDVGAVGIADDRDVGLAQVNHGAFPDTTVEQRMDPRFSINFIVDYLSESMRQGMYTRQAIASYNLGRGGARAWATDGSPDWWNPVTQSPAAPGAEGARNVKAYIDKILAG
jgi:hypothetical protein